MNSHAYRFVFTGKINLEEVEASLLLALLVAECLHGRARVRLDSSFRLDRKIRSCVIDAGTEVGRTISRVFSGFLSLEFGEEAFKVCPAVKENLSKSGRAPEAA